MDAARAENMAVPNADDGSAVVRRDKAAVRRIARRAQLNEEGTILSIIRSDDSDRINRRPL